MVDLNSAFGPGLTPGPLSVSGAPEGFDAVMLARLARRADGVVIHIARDDLRLQAMAEALAIVAADVPVLRFPAWDCLPYDRVSPSAEIVAQRLATLATLATRSSKGALVVLTTVNAASQRTLTAERVRALCWAAQVGQPVDREALIAYLGRNGYNRAATVTEPGDYAVRGGVIDIYPPGQRGPVRLDFFGDTLEEARRFDPETQRAVAKLRRVELAPVSEATLDPESIARFRSGYRLSFGSGTDDPLYAAVSEGAKHPGMEHWLPLYHERLDSLFEHLPDAPVSLDHQAEAAFTARIEAIADHYATRRDALTDKKLSGHAPVYKPLPPDRLYLTAQDWADALAGRSLWRFSPLRVPPGPGIIDAGARPGRDFAPERQNPEINLFDALTEHIRAQQRQRHVILACYSEGARERMAGLLADHGLKDIKPLTDLRDLPPRPQGGAGGVFLLIWPLERGFETADWLVIAEQDILGDRLIRRPGRKRKGADFITDHSALTPGDLVVHVEHGIGRYLGLSTLEIMGAPHDCLTLEYAEGAKLYLPVENVELLTRHGSEEVPLDRLGGGAWQARKAKLKERIREIAGQLIRVAAERSLRAGARLVPPAGTYEEFCARFPYTETEDQLRAIADVLDDMSSGKPMDRLVVGDVGFGKTEVALRAAFVAAMAGMQVAVIAPTTLLARQHAHNFLTRLKGWPLEVRQLSRFVSAKEAQETREGLANGQIDVVVGTHALLAKGISFKRLGLVIIDEEQHFGVAHKERLKQLRSEVHVLTMTATPIPRTLQLAMSGVRELSLIATPPVDRLAVRTYVSPFDPVVVREALLREKYRGGQAFWVVPRISDLADAESFLRENVPEVSFVVAHGQMAAGDLDERMNAFYDGQFDVLLSTTIIESGLDIPSANTLIVQHADRFGLAQLYQLRGRVGRSKARAYAYLTTAPGKPITPQAERRLRVLSSLEGLGAGFQLASHDMDIRGAGNLLGDEQSGHIREVGFELYQDMLQEAIAQLRSGEGAALPEDDDWSPQLGLGVPVLIPEHYVPDLDVRLGLYRRLSNLGERAELEGFAAELHDRFGKPPAEVETLLRVVQIKALCRKAQVARIDCGPKGATVSFRHDSFPNPGGLVRFVAEQGAAAKMRPDQKLVFIRDWDDEEKRVKGAHALVKELARIAVEPPTAVTVAPPPPKPPAKPTGLRVTARPMPAAPMRRR